MCVSFPCSVAAVRMADGLTFVIYEFWETEEEWKRLVQRCLYPMTWGWGYGKMELAASRLLSREETVGRMVKSLASGCRGFSIQASFLSWRACAFHPEAAGFLVGPLTQSLHMEPCMEISALRPPLPPSGAGSWSLAISSVAEGYGAERRDTAPVQNTAQAFR